MFDALKEAFELGRSLQVTVREFRPMPASTQHRKRARREWVKEIAYQKDRQHVVLAFGKSEAGHFMTVKDQVNSLVSHLSRNEVNNRVAW